MKRTLVLVALMAGTPVLAEEIVAVQVGRAITVSGDDIENATILIKGGEIVEIGKDVQVPAGAKVIKRPKAVAMPGLVNAHTTTGLRVPFERMSEVPFVTVLDGIDPSAPSLENALRDGVTTVHVMQANSSRVSAQSAIIRTAGAFVDDMIIKAPAGLKLTLKPSSGVTRMANMAAFRRTFFDLFERVKALQASKDPQPLDAKPEKRPALDSYLRLKADWASIDWKKVADDKIAERDRAMVSLVRGKLKALVQCSQATDVFKAFELIDANGLDATLILGSDVWKIADVLAAREKLGPVIIGPDLELWDTDEESEKEIRRFVPKILHDKGIRFALQPRETSSGSNLTRAGSYHLWHQAATLVRFGVPRKDALRAITLTPAEIIGLDHRMGSLEKGKDGNIAIFSGDPLDARSWVDLVLIEGDVVYEREKDVDLELLLRRPHRKF